MPNRNPANMRPEEIAAEIGAHRGSMEVSARRIAELSVALRDRMRRTGSEDEARNIYITCSNVWYRFAGMVNQGLQRTQQADRLLRMLPDEEEFPADTNEPTRPTPADQAQIVPTPSPLEDLITVYGEELVSDADGPAR